MLADALQDIDQVGVDVDAVEPASHDEAMHDTHLERTPEASRLRRQTVEHPFGTLKAWMGSTNFLTKTLPRVSTEMSLHVLA
jgi:hypothetical protein